MDQILKKSLEKIGIEITDRQKEQFDAYHKLLEEWNKVMNLTGITEYEEVVERTEKLIKERQEIYDTNGAIDILVEWEFLQMKYLREEIIVVLLYGKGRKSLLFFQRWEVLPNLFFHMEKQRIKLLTSFLVKQQRIKSIHLNNP